MGNERRREGSKSKGSEKRETEGFVLYVYSSICSPSNWKTREAICKVGYGVCVVSTCTYETRGKYWWLHVLCMQMWPISQFVVHSCTSGINQWAYMYLTPHDILS